MCCAGCEAVSQAIVDAGMQDYYANRSAPASAPAQLPPGLENLALFDEPEVSTRYVRSDGEMLSATLLMDGLRCGACVWLIERTIAAQPGVKQASVNFATERAVLRWDPRLTSLSTLLGRIAQIGYRAQPFDAQRREEQLARGSRQLVRRLFVAGIGMMQVMMYALPGYTDSESVEPEFAALMRWASLLLTLPVVLYSGRPFLDGALRDLRARSLGMDVPVTIGILAAFVASVHATVTDRGEVYFDSVTMFVFLLLAARYLEWVARRRASRAVDAMAAAMPETVSRIAAIPPDLSEQSLAEATIEQVPAARIICGDLIRVGTGERFAVDGVIVAASTQVDQSLLTGESRPIPRGEGDEIAGGSVNAGNPVWLRATRVSTESTLSTIERLIDRAAIDRPAIALAADRVATWFVLALLMLTAAVALAWAELDPQRVLPISIAVLVVSCPCALSLATPAALAAATGALTRRGVLVTSGRALETIAACTDVVFDKTGTLTQGQARVARIDCVAGDDPLHWLSLAAALGSGSSHPLAQALVASARERGAPPAAAVHIQSIPGHGIQGKVQAIALRLGSREFAAQWSPLPAPAVDEDNSQVWLVAQGKALARFTLEDTIRNDAAGTVQALADAGLQIHLLSGDQPGPVFAIATELAIDMHRAQATPADKIAYVRDLQARGRKVLMIGDGINDAPVLAAADASVAVGNATALARIAADTVLLADSLSLVASLVALARRCRRIIRQNLAWAAAYNAVAIPAAALGLVPAWAAALGMSGSSLLVVGNALRLRLGRHARMQG
jgi:Cu2+-exporting ATPase